ncbi:MAG: TetR/AcrR family transcriptional regulator [Anaerolineaceae bacterium]
MTQQQRSEETRSRIISTAFACFARYGYDATGVAEICSEAGVSKGAFYHHFPSKQAVFLELMKLWLSGVEEETRKLLSSTLPVPERFMHFAGLIHGISSDAEGRLNIVLEYYSRASRDKYVWQETVAPYQHFTDLISGVIQEGIDEGSIRPVDPQVAARAMVSLAIGILLQGLVSSQEVDWGQVTQDSLQMFFKGLQT